MKVPPPVIAGSAAQRLLSFVGRYRRAKHAHSEWQRQRVGMRCWWVGDRWVEGDPTGMRAANPWMPERVSHVAARAIEELDGARGNADSDATAPSKRPAQL